MEEKEITELSESLKGWKEKIPTATKGFLSWEKDLVFTARIRGYQFEYDPKAVEGCWPTDTLLMSLAGCLAIDVVTFLQKMKAGIKNFEIEILGAIQNFSLGQRYISSMMPPWLGEKTKQKSRLSF